MLRLATVQHGHHQLNVRRSVVGHEFAWWLDVTDMLLPLPTTLSGWAALLCQAPCFK